ncbi:MAG: ankyrin repeat domain-containing protein, partial [Actinomycetota bacterium]|nr:ankyrin repeat domain-containing protein [Actinomycetota bacterium]
MTQDVNAHLGRDGRSQLHAAAAANDVERARALLDDGADVNLHDRLGFTPLHFAAQEWALEVASLLLENGAEVDSLNMYGNSPLFVATVASRGRGELIELLRRCGADPLLV